MVNYINSFVKSYKPHLHFWNISHLVMKYQSFNIFSGFCSRYARLSLRLQFDCKQCILTVPLFKKKKNDGPTLSSKFKVNSFKIMYVL